MNILLLTMDEPIYMPEYLEPILKQHSKKIKKVVIAPHPNNNLSTLIQQRYKMFGLKAFTKYSLQFGRGKLFATLPGGIQQSLTGRYHSVRSLCDAFDVPVNTEQDINQNRFLTAVRASNIDLILSISCGQKLGSELLSIPSEGAINIHGSLLPKYRGRATAFWVLYHNEEYSGVTAHYMTEEFDGGEIVLQKQFPIADDDTMHDVYNKIVRTGADVASDVIERVEQNEINTKPNPQSEGEYRSLPSVEDRQEFFRQGNQFR